MSYADRFRVEPGSRVKLADIDPGFKDHRESHEEANEEIEQDPRTEEARREYVNPTRLEDVA